LGPKLCICLKNGFGWQGYAVNATVQQGLQRTGEIEARLSLSVWPTTSPGPPALKRALDGPAGKVVEFLTRITTTGLALEETAVRFPAKPRKLCALSRCEGGSSQRPVGFSGCALRKWFGGRERPCCHAHIWQSQRQFLAKPSGSGTSFGVCSGV